MTTPSSHYVQCTVLPVYLSFEAFSDDLPTLLRLGVVLKPQSHLYALAIAPLILPQTLIQLYAQ